MAGSGRRAASRPTNRSTRFIHRTGTPVTVSIPLAGAPDADATSRGTPSGMGRSPARVDRVSLSEALSAQRIRADGTVVDLHGEIGLADMRPDALLYLNTSLGWPALPGVRVGVAVIDRASFRNAETLTRALAWC